MANGRAERTLERKLTLAKEINSWVIQANVPETRMFLRMARDVDRAMRILRSGLMLRYKPEEVLPLFNKLYEEAKRLNEIVKKLCEKAGIPYREPRELQAAINGQNLAEGNFDQFDDEEEEDIKV